MEVSRPRAPDGNPCRSAKQGILNTLRDDVLWEVIGWLPRCDQLRVRWVCRMMQTAAELHFANADMIERNDLLTAAADCGSRFPYALLLAGLPLFHNLRCLHLSGMRDYVDNIICAFLGFAAPPTLESVDVSACPSVTNLGVYMLMQGRLRYSLRYIDLTFTSTDYSAVLQLYNVCPGIVVQRLPKWLNGHFQCPWNEVHTYYPDGAFVFTRSQESKGFVWCITDHGEYLSDKIQYLDAYVLPHTLFRPGVLLKREADDVVVVVQARWQLDPPHEFPPPQVYESLAVGVSMPVTINEGIILVSKMKVVPLEPDQQRPPQKLVEEIKAYAHATYLSSPLFPFVDYEEDAQMFLQNREDHPLLRHRPR